MKNTELCPLQIEDKIIEIRNQNVILDCDVATLYGVQTKEVNQAIKNNPEKFPNGFVFELTDLETGCSRSKFLTLNNRPLNQLVRKQNHLEIFLDCF